MFSQFKPTMKVAYFGEWADEEATPRMTEAALKVLWDAVMRTYEEDVKTQEVLQAIAYIESQCGYKKHPAVSFRKALDIPLSAERFREMRDAYYRIGKALGVYDGSLS